jgi:zinc transport system ATP-binding protein
MEPVLSVSGLCFGYGPVEVLCEVTFSLEPGDYLALAGPNGAGKTTLVKTILGLASRRRGTVRLFGADLDRFQDWQRIGYLPQRTSSFNPLLPATVGEVVGLGLLAGKRFPRRLDPADNARILKALDLLNITGLKDRLLNELSGGQQQRVFLARALVTGPELLILDEPSTALDSHARETFLELTRRLNREQGVTIILISHDTTRLGRYVNKLLYLDKRVVFFGGYDDFCTSNTMEHYFGSCPSD